MEAAKIVFPVFVMMALGIVCRSKNWITPEQKDGIKSFVFKVLFPVLIFSVVVSSEFHSNSILVIGYTFICFSLTPLLGKIIGKIIKIDYPDSSPYLLTSCEGGNLVLPLYITVAGAANAGNVVLVDLAGIFITFVLIPIIVIRKTSGNADAKTLVIRVIKDKFVIAVTLGLLMNLTGIYAMMKNSFIFPFYDSAMSYLTAPITSLILFIVGFELKLELKMLPSLLKLMALRAGLLALVILGYFLLFPALMADKMFMVAVLLYFTATTGFGVLIGISPLFKSEEEEHYASSFVSTYIIIEIVAYAAIVFLVV